MSKKIFVTGGAGFISSHLEDILVENDYEIISADILDANKCHNISHLMDKNNFTYIKMNVANTGDLVEATKRCDMIYHLAANSDIKLGGQNPMIDYNNTFQTTMSVLESMRVNNIPNLFFSSTSAVYGDMKGKLDETTGGLKPISYYGAYKLASEALISAYSYMNGFNALVFRFPNVVGPRITHGVVFDFIRKLKKDSNRLQILGNGKQNKQYVYVTDLVKGIYDFTKKMERGYTLFNISVDSFINVDTIADLVCEYMGLKDVKYEYTGGNCGWKGDVPSFDLNISKAKNNGWKFKFDSKDSIVETLRNTNINAI